MSQDSPHRDERGDVERRKWVRDRLLSDYDVPDAAVHYATEGLLDTEDLWWLYDNYHLMAPGAAWLLADMWQSDDFESNDDLASPSFWSWWDLGPLDAKRADDA